MDQSSNEPNRAGLRSGNVSEFTVIVPLRTGAGAQLRSVLDAQGGRFELADQVGTVHDMRFVLFDDDTRLLFATTYDGDWDSYISDFATKIPDALDRLFAAVEGWPGIRAPDVGDFIVRHQVTASAWYCAYPGASVVDIRRGQRVLTAFESLLDAASH